MEKCFKFFILSFVMPLLVVSCAKKPLTLDDTTSMKTLLKASDKEITELVIKEAAEKGDINPKDLNIEYILRDKESQTIVVKSKINESK
ncbi:hypothetical protein IZU27_02970 [Treponema socranskii]|uniref:hypothetical protein n=1 Tax=Treponema socranskii TaxID=53419 RepID=UPI003D8C5C33